MVIMPKNLIYINSCNHSHREGILMLHSGVMGWFPQSGLVFGKKIITWTDCDVTISPNVLVLRRILPIWVQVGKNCTRNADVWGYCDITFRSHCDEHLLLERLRSLVPVLTAGLTRWYWKGCNWHGYTHCFWQGSHPEPLDTFMTGRNFRNGIFLHQSRHLDASSPVEFLFVSQLLKVEDPCLPTPNIWHWLQ